MILFDSIKKSLAITLKTPAIALFFVLFLILINILGAYTMQSRTGLITAVLAFCIYALICVFFAGWFHVAKESFDKDENKEKNFYSIFLEGIGMNWVLSALGVLVYFLIFILFVMLAKELAHFVFGSIDFLVKDLANVPANNEAMTKYFTSLTTDQKYVIFCWQMTFIGLISIFNFLFLFYFPALFENSRKENIFIRPLKAIYRCVFFTIKNFFAVIAVAILIHLTNIVLALLNAAAGNHGLLSVLILFVYIYFVTFTIVLIFNYYDAKENAKKDSCDNGADSLGQNGADDKISEDNQ